MLQVLIDNAKPGMRLALPVSNPGAPDRTLLKKGYELEQRTIDRLLRLEVSRLWVAYPGLDVLDKHIDPHLRQEQDVLANRLFGAFERVQGRSSAKVSYDAYVSSMARLIESMLANPTAGMFLGTASTEQPTLIDHSSAVAHLTLLMGMKLKDYIVAERSTLPRRAATNLTNLGLGAMLHDIGTTQLDRDVLEAFERTGDVSDPAWQRHTQLGYDMVAGKVAPSAAVIVRHHHQLWDGTGFVHGGRVLSGDAIHVFPRIVAVAENFVRRCNPSRGVFVPAVQAIASMIEGPDATKFDPRVLYTFLAVAPPYPPGRMVQLSDGSWAVPLDHSPRDPCRPTVQIIDAPDALGAGEARDDHIVDLRERRDLYVVQAEGHDVAGLNFDSPHLSTNTRLAPAES